MKKKEEVLRQLRKALQEQIRRKNISQSELVNLCHEKGYDIRQPELSKLINGKTSLNLYQYVALCDVLELETSVAVKGQREVAGAIGLQNRSLDVHPDSDAFNGFLGRYSCFFFSTDRYGHKLHRAELILEKSKDGQYCRAGFELPLEDELNGKGYNSSKKYEGQLIIGRNVGTGYCILEGVNVPEISVIAFRHRSFLVKHAECRIALALTTSSGEVKAPTCHKMFMVFGEAVDADDLKDILPYMNFYPDHDILISQEEMEKLYAGEAGELLKSACKNLMPVPYYEVGEELLRKGNKAASRKDIALAMARILEKGDLLHMVQVMESDDSRAFELLKKVLLEKQAPSKDSGHILE